MSRIGKKPIAVPAGVKVAVKDGVVNLEGPKGKLSFKPHATVKVTWAESEKAINVSSDDASGDSNKFWGTARAIIRNMVEGVNKGYEKNLQVVGTGWAASLAGKQLKVICGLANPLFFEIPTGLTVTVDKATGEITPIKVAGVDRQLVGQFAAAVREKRKPEPYNGKGIKYTEEVIKRKQGKQFGA